MVDKILPRRNRTWSTRSVGQRLTHRATEAPRDRGSVMGNTPDYQSRSCKIDPLLLIHVL